MYRAINTCKPPQNHPFSFMLKITPSTIIGKKNTIRRIPQIVKLPLNLSVIISIVLFIYLNIRINNTGGNFFYRLFLPPKGERKRVTRTGLYRVTRQVASPGYQTGLNWVLERVSTGYRIELLGGFLYIKRVYRTGIYYRFSLL